MLICIQFHICEHRSMSDNTWINQYLITYMDLLVYVYAYLYKVLDKQTTAEGELKGNSSCLIKGINAEIYMCLDVCLSL